MIKLKYNRTLPYKFFQRYGVFFILFMLYLPAVWYSANTPFALIDDYACSWNIVKVFSSIAGIKSWFSNLLFHYVEGGRFRPFYDLYNLLTWGIFAENYMLHHMFRLVIKLLIIIFSFKIISIFNKKTAYTFNFPFFVFLSIYLFFPNNPEARLAPQELNLVLFLSIMTYYLCKLLINNNFNIQTVRKVDYILLLSSFTLLGLTKEPAIAFTAPALFFIIIMNFNLKAFVRITPFIIIFLVTFLKIYYAQKVGGYGIASLTLSLIFENLRGWFYFVNIFSKDFFIFFVSFILFFIIGKIKEIKLISKIKNLKKEKLNYINIFRQIFIYNTQFSCYFILLTFFISFSIISLTFWMHVVRYYYPLTYLISILVGISSSQINCLLKHHLKIKLVYIIFCIYFFFFNYFNFLYQFTRQYYIRNLEKEVISYTENLIKNNNIVYNIITNEYTNNLRYYFDDYLPFYQNRYLKLHTVTQENFYKEINNKNQKNIYLIAYTEKNINGFSKVFHFQEREKTKLLEFAKTMASFVSPEKKIVYWLDAGTGNYGGGWYVYKKNSPVL